MFFTLVPSLCVHVSLWTYNFMIGVYLETYTHESSYILSWYSNSLSDHLFIDFHSLVLSKRICSMSAYFILLHPIALIFGEVSYTLVLP